MSAAMYRPEVAGRVGESGDGAAEQQQRDRLGQDRDEHDRAADDARPPARAACPPRRPQRSMTSAMRLAAAAVPMVVVAVGRPPSAAPPDSSAATSVADRHRGDVAGAPERRPRANSTQRIRRRRRGSSSGGIRSAACRGADDRRWLGHPTSASSVGQVLGAAVRRDRDDGHVVGAGSVAARAIRARVGRRSPIGDHRIEQAIAARSLPIGRPRIPGAPTRRGRSACAGTASGRPGPHRRPRRGPPAG